MVAIIDAGKEINIGAFRLTRRGNNEAYKLRGGEIWISNDTSNDSKLPAAPTQEDFDNTNKCPYDYNEGLYKEWFENKKWEKALTFDYGNSNTLTNIHYSGNLKARYIQVKLTTPGEGITEVHLDEIHILGY